MPHLFATRAEEIDAYFPFPSGALVAGKDNVITIVQDNMGLNETNAEFDGNASKSPRGVRGFHLVNGTFTQWRVQGKVGGYKRLVDAVELLFPISDP